jgi:hypothetical protein
MENNLMSNNEHVTQQNSATGHAGQPGPMTGEKKPAKSLEDVYDTVGQVTVENEFARVTGLRPVKRYTVVQRQGGNFYRAMTLATDKDEAYRQALTLQTSDFRQVDGCYRIAFAGLDEADNLVVFDESAEPHIAEGKVRWAD